ncbi:MAG TPA: TonB-dependent receptor [Azonexus sp.]
MIRSSRRVLAAAGALVALPAMAGDPDLQALRAEISQLKAAYEQRIAALEARLQSAEPARPAPLPVAEPASAGRPAGSFNPEVSLILQGQYKNMKESRAPGITGFASAAGHDHGDGSEGVSKRGFSVDHTELVLAANIDPYWRGQAIIAALDGEAEVEEAWFQSLAIGHGIGLKGGRLRSGIGYLNEQHAHVQDFADAPLMYQALFGEHGSYTQDGVQLKWLAPTPIFVEFGAELGRGAEFPGTDRNKNGAGSGAVFVHLGDDVGIEHSWRAGVSYLRTRADEREAHFADINGGEAVGAFDGRSSTWLADFVWKWAPDGNPRERNLKLQAEYFQRRENGSLRCFDEEGLGNACDPLAAGASVTSDYKTRQSGWYAQGVYQFTPNWRAGLRYEQLDSGSRQFGANAANLVVDSYRPKKATAMADYSWSEFSRLRLQYARDQSQQGLTDHQWTLQYVMSLGAHGAHKF